MNFRGSTAPYAGPVPAAVHLHGGEVPSAFDGGPDAWFTPGLGYTGSGFVTNTYTYPNAFAPQNVAVGSVSPGINVYPFDPRADMGTTDSFGYPGGPGYVWHCHIIDHEDNEMMRPYKVKN